MRKRNGFSLIELLIVVTIIAIIAAIAIPNLLAARRAVNEAKAKETVLAFATQNRACLRSKTCFASVPDDTRGYHYALEQETRYGTVMYTLTAEPNSSEGFARTGDLSFVVSGYTAWSVNKATGESTLLATATADDQ